ncbi:hypothetical protein JZ751_026914 [Albula glossodonta]|uniref:Pus10 N-terminal eukaryotes domain-containing protein n=1 Tax=Albula glossodonta TaxID=121402 RepID=A0A8T2PLI2_9TELE|nr:hypothetical protein JZ751_026914 [Albula glossodonta]
MLPLKVKDRPIVRTLLAAGCCARCILRFCCIGLQSAYRQPYEDLAKELLAFASAEESDKSNDATDKEPTEDPPCKKMRLETEQSHTEGGDKAETSPAQAQTDPDSADSEVCVVCLGVLQHFCDKAFAKKVSEAVATERYQFDSLVLSVSLPAQLSVRENKVSVRGWGYRCSASRPRRVQPPSELHDARALNLSRDVRAGAGRADRATELDGDFLSVSAHLPPSTSTHNPLQCRQPGQYGACRTGHA